jgi:hypothetical protein
VHLSWTTDRTRAILALDEIVRKRDVDGTRFYAAQERTLRREFRNVVGRRAVVVLTDGQDTSYSHEYDQDLKNALKAARELRIPVYFVALENEGDARIVLPRTRQYLLEVREYMQQLADSSGGQLLFPKTLQDVMPMYEQIGRARGTSYSLGYVPSGQARGGGYRRLEVKTRAGGLRSRVPDTWRDRKLESVAEGVFSRALCVNCETEGVNPPTEGVNPLTDGVSRVARSVPRLTEAMPPATGTVPGVTKDIPRLTGTVFSFFSESLRFFQKGAYPTLSSTNLGTSAIDIPYIKD